MRRYILLVLISGLLFSGCRTNQSRQPLFGGGYQPGPNGPSFAANQNPGLGGGTGIFSPDSTPFQLQQASQQANQLVNQVGSLNSRLSQFDSDNQNLHAQVAALQQRLQNANSYNDQLKQQLSDQMSQLQQAQVQVQQTTAQAQQQIAAARQNAQLSQPASNAAFPNSAFPNRQVRGQLTGGQNLGSPPSRFSGATIRANNGLMQNLQAIQLPGYKVWMDGDVIRIEGPTDRLFVSGSYQLNQNDAQAIARLASVIRQNFSRQVVGVEAHWDGTPIQPATTSHHQLTATQALSVFDLLVKSGLPHDQVFTMAMGSNRFRYPQGNPANRRIEIVIYPETF